MKKFKYITIMLELGFCIALTTGCFPEVKSDSAIDSGENREITTNAADDFPAQITDDSVDKLNIDAKVLLPKNFDINQKISAATAEYKEWDKDSIVEGISNGRQILNEDTVENSEEENPTYVYTFQDDSILSFTNGDVSYYTQEEVESQYSYYFDDFENYIDANTLNETFGDKEIEGIQKEDALKSADNILELLGVKDSVAEPSIYSMDAQSMKNLQKEDGTTDKYGNKVQTWKEEQEAYFIIYPVLYENIPSTGMNAIGENEFISSPKAYFVYGRNGLITWFVSGITELKENGNKTAIYSPTEVTDNLKEFFQSIVMDTSVDISLLKLTYIIRNDMDDVNKLTVEPVWLIYGSYDEEPIGELEKSALKGREYISVISAVTGKTVSIASIGG